MSHKSYALATCVIFFVIAVLHLLRSILGWEAIVGGWVVPQWVSWAALVVGGYLGYEGFRLSRAK